VHQRDSDFTQANVQMESLVDQLHSLRTNLQVYFAPTRLR